MQTPGTESGSAPPETISREELQLATRNHGMPLEALQWSITPVGLHYLLIHYDIPFIDPGAWRLTVTGRVRRELSLTLDQVRGRRKVTVPATFECAGNGRAQLTPRPITQPWVLEAVGTAEWTGTPLRALLEDAEIEEDAAEVVFTGTDRGMEKGVEQDYERSLSLDEAMLDDVLLAYEMNGMPLLPQHGAPLRLLVPGWYGMTNVKWLRSIAVVSEPFHGYQMERAYRMWASEDDPGVPITRIMPRSLMVPPGIPEFLSRHRILAPGPCRLEGRAWSGWGPIAGVEVSTDGGGTWEDATLGDQPGPWAWHSWSYHWRTPSPGTHDVCSRATDAAGNLQPLDPSWNVGGYANNAVQVVTVEVREEGG
jgi:sulfane dehydrogenase subunit SoxC